jgi:hypothetical protein
VNTHGKTLLEIYFISSGKSWSRWPCGLRRRSAAFHLLGLQVRIHLGTWLSLVIVVCCQVEVSVMGWSLVKRSPTECGVSVCDLKTSIKVAAWAQVGLFCHSGKKFGNREVYSIFNTCCIISVLFSTKCHLYNSFIFSVQKICSS